MPKKSQKTKGLHVINMLYMEELPQECIDDCSKQGANDGDVKHWREKLNFTVDCDKARKFVDAWGSHTEEELAALTAEELADYVLWEACHTFSEQQAWNKRNPGKDPRDSSEGCDCINIADY